MGWVDDGDLSLLVFVASLPVPKSSGSEASPTRTGSPFVLESIVVIEIELTQGKALERQMWKPK